MTGEGAPDVAAGFSRRITMEDTTTTTLVTLDEIRAARERIRPAARFTPLI